MRFALTLLFVSSLVAQHADNGEAKWADASGLSVETVHRLWRSISHFADERDDDSQIVLLDTQSLAARNQWLMVTAAGLPTCLTITVFSKAAGNPQLWSEASTPDGNRFCETVGIKPEVTVSKVGIKPEGRILVKAPIGMHSAHASHADVAEYEYAWAGKTYTLYYQEVRLQFVPPSERPK